MFVVVFFLPLHFKIFFTLFVNDFKVCSPVYFSLFLVFCFAASILALWLAFSQAAKSKNNLRSGGGGGDCGIGGSIKTMLGLWE